LKSVIGLLIKTLLNSKIRLLNYKQKELVLCDVIIIKTISTHRRMEHIDSVECGLASLFKSKH